MEISSNEWWKKNHDYADEQIAKEKEWDRTHKSESVYDRDYEIVIKNNRQYLVKKKNVKESYNEDCRISFDLFFDKILESFYTLFL